METDEREVMSPKVEAEVSKWPDPLVEDFTDSEWPDLSQSDANVQAWVLKNKKILLRTITWNLCAKPPPGKDKLLKTLLVKK